MYHQRLAHKNIAHKDVRAKANDKVYFWIVGTSNKTGRRIIYGWKPSYEEAERVGAGIQGASIEVHLLHTRDETEAARLLRATVLEESHDIDEALRRFKHDIKAQG